MHILVEISFLLFTLKPILLCFILHLFFVYMHFHPFFIANFASHLMWNPCEVYGISEESCIFFLFFFIAVASNI